MTILSLWPKKQVGESYSLAIRNLTQVLNASAGLHSVSLLLISVIKRLNRGYVKALKKKEAKAFQGATLAQNGKFTIS